MQYIYPITAPEALDANRFGPKAANVARLGSWGLPIPAGFCLDAAAYRAQVKALGLEADARGVMSATESPQARRHALNMKLGLLDQQIIPEILDQLRHGDELRLGTTSSRRDYVHTRDTAEALIRLADLPPDQPGLRLPALPSLADMLSSTGAIGCHAAAHWGAASRPVRGLVASGLCGAVGRPRTVVVAVFERPEAPIPFVASTRNQ